VSVVDASVWLGLATGEVPPERLPEDELLVPAHFDAEVLSGLRGLVRGGHLDGGDGEEWWTATLDAPLVRVPLTDLARAWTMAATVSAYDAPYVALAQRADTPLVTLDRRLAAGAAGLCAIALLARP